MNQPKKAIPIDAVSAYPTEFVVKTDAFQLDLACLCARLRQMQDEGYDNGHFLLDRVITCDLPRMEKYLNHTFSAHLSDIIMEMVSKK